MRLAVTGQPGSLPPGVSLSGYRIIQEALANVARHAPRAATTVTLDYRAGQLDVEIVNAAPPAGRRSARPALPARRPGRAWHAGTGRAHGGQLTAGAEPGGGFAVRASIPDAPAGAARA